MSKAAFYLIAAVLMAGCSGPAAVKTATNSVNRSLGAKIQRPAPDTPVIVKNFSVADAALTAEKAEESWMTEAKKNQIREYAGAAVTAGLRNEGFNAIPYIDGAAAPAGSFILDGTLRKVAEASGSVSLKAEVRLYRADVPRSILAEFDSAGRSAGPGKWDDMAKDASIALAKDIVNRLVSRTFEAPQAR